MREQDFAFTEKAIKFLVEIRLARPWDEQLFREVELQLREVCQNYSGKSSVPTELVRVLVDIVPTLDASALLYPTNSSEQIKSAAATLSQIILTEL